MDRQARDESGSGGADPSLPRRRRPRAAAIAVEPFEAIPKGARAELEREAAALVRFVEPDASAHDVRFAKPR